MENKEIINKFCKDNGLEERGYYLVLADIPACSCINGKLFVIEKGSIIRFDYLKVQDFSEEGSEKGKNTVVAVVCKCLELKQEICMNKYNKTYTIPESERSKIVFGSSAVAECLRLVPAEYVNEFNSEAKKFDEEIDEVDLEYRRKKTYGSLFASVSGVAIVCAIWLKMLTLFSEGRLSFFYVLSVTWITFYVFYQRSTMKKLKERKETLYQTHNRNFYEAYSNFLKKCSLLAENS